ncbi:hypothetical protein CEXT_153501 [Caerostris extrusa]|uniref:Uncharacterized protein n=1 Tax=Caerostris extrusa TaxID=172846 RepID=A0AAV4WXC7_CAEEX|nr:hypothetical protein CEXT_153501 [Caerostris extrusa]
MQKRGLNFCKHWFEAHVARLVVFTWISEVTSRLFFLFACLRGLFEFKCERTVAVCRSWAWLHENIFDRLFNILNSELWRKYLAYLLIFTDLP